MASIQEYLEMLNTSQLQALLREECAGRGELPLETMIDICEILSERNPELPTLKHTLLQCFRCYLDE